MSDSLVTIFVKNRKQIATMYQPWDGRTLPAMMNLRAIINSSFDRKIETGVDVLFWMREVFGSGITEEDRDYLQGLGLNPDNFPVKTKENQNPNKELLAGRVALSQKSMRSQRSFAWNSMRINLDAQRVSFHTWLVFDTLDDYEAFCEEYNRCFDSRKIITTEYDLEHFFFLDFPEIDNLIQADWRNRNILFFSEKTKKYYKID